MQLNPAEISELIKSRIEGLAASADIRNQGTVVSVADGITRIHATMLSANPPALALMAVIAERLRDGGHVAGVHEVVAELGAAA